MIGIWTRLFFSFLICMLAAAVIDTENRILVYISGIGLVISTIGVIWTLP